MAIWQVLDRLPLPKALPALDDRLRWPFLAIWSALLAVSLFALIGSLIASASMITVPLSPHEVVGLAPHDDLGWPTIGHVGPVAQRAGIKPGDKLTAIDGRAVPTTKAEIDRALFGSTGSVVVVQTTSIAGRISVHRLVRDPVAARQALSDVHLSESFYYAARQVMNYLCYDVLLLVCAIMLMVRRWHDRLAPWTSLMMLVFLLGFGRSAHWLSPFVTGSDDLYVLLNEVASCFLILILAVFPTGRFEPRWSLAVAAVAIGVQVWMGDRLSGAASNAELVAAQAAAVATIIARYRQMPPGIGRQQIRWAVFGFAASTVALLIASLLEIGANYATTIAVHDWIVLIDDSSFCVCTALLMLGLTVSLLRYRLYMGERLGALAGALGAAAAAVCIVPLHHRATRWAEKRFRSGLVELRHGLPLLLADLRETASPAQLADAVLAHVETGVRARHGAVVVGDTLLDARDIDPALAERAVAERHLSRVRGTTLQCERDDPVFPLRLPLPANSGLDAWLLLGPRPDGSFYGLDERQALQEIADPVARALTVSIERERQQLILRSDIASLRDQLAAFRQSIFAHLGIDAAPDCADLSR